MILIGDVREQLRTLPAESVHCVVTSPPYWGLRDYGTAKWEGGDTDCDHKPECQPRTDRERNGLTGGLDYLSAQEPKYRDVCGKCGARRIDRQIGLEPTPQEYVAVMVDVFREVKRVLRDDGTLWLNLGDSYGSGTIGRNDTGLTSGMGGPFNGGPIGKYARPIDLKPKDLCGIPWRVAFALQADGWYLRSDIIWSKPNPMPESVTDRPTKAHEYLFLLAKSQRYYFDCEAVREAASTPWHGIGGYREGNIDNGWKPDEYRNDDRERAGRNIRTVWHIPTQPYSGAHFATFPEKLVEPCIKAGTSERGVCGKCGAGWERVVEARTAMSFGEWREKNGGRIGAGKARIGDPRQPDKNALGYGGEMPRYYMEVFGTTGPPPAITIGWHHACTCEAPTQDATVLDPFCGSGTVGLVARRLGRDFIGIELNPTYAAMAEQRIGSYAPLFEESPPCNGLHPSNAPAGPGLFSPA